MRPMRMAGGWPACLEPLFDPETNLLMARESTKNGICSARTQHIILFLHLRRGVSSETRGE